MSSQLLPSDIFDCAEQHHQQARNLMVIRLRLQKELGDLISSGATLADINAKKAEIEEVNKRISGEVRTAVDLDVRAIVDIIAATDVQDAMKAINCATEKVNDAVEKIKTVRRALEYVDLFIRLGGAIASAALTRSPAAQIKAIVEAVDTLYQTDFKTAPSGKPPSSCV